MKYERPILASVLYGIAILEVVATLIVAAVVAGGGSREIGSFEKAIGVPFILGYGFAFALLTAGAGQVYDLLGKIEFNTRVVRLDVESRQEEQARSATGTSSARYIPGINA